ncbi:MAG: ASKHA domain-containing protein [Alphaproteobacteria bacterium]|nr:ASKHA domain-containing protein [Alphaproteobacteria bacterium]
MPDDALIVFLPSGRRGRFPIGTPVLKAARKLGVDIDSICGGRGICGRCQITLGTGEYPKFGIVSRTDHLSRPGDLERTYADGKGLAEGRRLSCAVRVEGDAVIDVPAESQLHKQIVRKEVESRPVEIDPVVRLHYLEMDAPSIRDQRSDVERVRAALAEQWQISLEAVDQRLLKRLPGVLRQAAWKITVAVREGRRLVAVWPGFHARAFGLAVDVGTTTIAVHLCDLGTGEVVAAAGAMNPQIRFGEDLISRISFIQQNPEDRDEPTAVVRRAIGDLVRETTGAAGVEADDVLEVTFVGNPIMHHILLGIDPLQLGRAPFPLAVETALTFAASDLGLDLNSGARAYTLPCIAGHVGADTAGVLLAEAPHRSDEMMLVIDLGTNAEIVLGNRHRLLACSSPTGPAFEGAQISCGQRAAPGAVERVRIDPATLAPRFKVIGSDKWSDDEGFAGSVADFGVTGICGSGIIEAVAEMYLAGVIQASGYLDGGRHGGNPHIVADGDAFAYRLHDGEPGIVITQTDVRAIQLAKAALYAGARLLMDIMGVAEPDRIVLAGAFGSYIDPKHALILGMVPDCPLERMRAAGNAAGTGARIALLNRATRAEIEALARRVEKVETAAQKNFQKHFVAAMGIPHGEHPFPNLARVVTLPAATANPRTSRVARRSRTDAA